MIYHCCMDLDFIIRCPPEKAAMIARRPDTGIQMESHEIKAHALILKAKGFEVMPGCNHHDSRGHCLGHEKATA